ncbi:MAG: hypothetical protein PHS59_18315 [Paludibacter sp.]|nr:hypothetical protein [Paludibacter sp.]
MKKNPYIEDVIKKCDVCRQGVNVDQYGNGECHHCGWKQDKDVFDFPDRVMYPNLVSFNKAKSLFRQGKKFIPSFEDFVGGLFYYSEMQFDYKSKRFGVVLRKGYSIEFFEFDKEEGYQVYKTKDEFMTNAHIDDMLLRDIWDAVENANYMICE